MATILQQIENFLGFGSPSGASAVSPTSGSSGTAFALQVSNNALTSGAEKVYIAAPNGASIDASSSQSAAIIIGNTGNDHLIGGNGPNLIIGGPGTNVMTGGPNADVFGHSAGATDYITNFNPNGGEKIALQQGLSYSSATTATVDPSSLGLSGSPATSDVLSFSDGSHVTLLGVTAAPADSWFI